MGITVEYVPEIDTLAIVTIKETQSASLRTTNAILIAGLLIASYFLNILFIIAVMITKQFRTSINLMYCHLTFINIIDLSFNILLALIFVANGNWNLSNGWCTFNVAVQQFVHLHTLFLLMLIGVERAMGSILGLDFITHGHKYLTKNKIGGLNVFMVFVSSVFASVVFLNSIPTKPFRNRYICGIDSGCPIGYIIVRLLVYFGCLIVIIVAIGAILKKRTAASIPSNSQEYSEFIKRNHAMQEHTSRGKLMILLTVVFILVEGPYITLCFVFESFNSVELKEEGLDIPQDADTLFTWLKFVFPLLCPIILLCWCNDIWLKVKEVMCCRSYDPPTIGHLPAYQGSEGHISQTPSVMTIVETDDGPHLSNPPQRFLWSTFANNASPQFTISDDPASTTVGETQVSPTQNETRHSSNERKSKIVVTSKKLSKQKVEKAAGGTKAKNKKTTVKRTNPTWKN